jgi:hypothetical protein
MKKALAEVDMLQLISELQTRQAAMEARLEKLDPTPRLETREPYPVGSSVYSITDLEARHPLTVRGYDRPGRILVLMSAGEPERSLPLESVRPLEQCPRATPTPGQIYAHLDDKTREYMEGRRTAEIEAKTKPFTPPIPHQQRYGW